MKKIMFYGVAALALAACDKKTDENVIAQTCGDYAVEIKLSENADTLTAVINGDETILTHAVSASGARFVGTLNDTMVTLWNKGESWTMFLGDDDNAVAIECVAK